ncbi:MAG: hypothetical protein HW412_664 [Bacteroidetes bacterium]|nr:hypothetical protein [Bacteroidota bacterium]
MKTNTKNSTTVLSRWTHFLGAMLMAALMVPAIAVSQAVNLGTAASFAVLAGSGVTNTGPTLLTGDLGTFPTISITGFPPGIVGPPGVNHAGDAVTQLAKNDLVIAYNDAAGRALNFTVSADLGGQTLVPGVYFSASSMALTGTVTLNGQGNPNAVFIFQAGSTLVTASGSSVNLINGAQACNVFWQVGSSATLGTTTSFVGNILALASITMNTGATIRGRVLARNAAVTLDANTVNPPQCSAQACPGNVPPAFVSPTPTCGTIFNVTVGTPISFTVAASDANPGPVQLSVTGLPAGAAMTPALPTNGNPVQSTFSWTPTSGQTGLTVVTFTAQDTCAGLAQCSFTFIVASAFPCPNNVPPAFVSPTPTCGTIFNVTVGTPISFTVAASDANPGPVQLSVTGLPVGATMTPALPTTGNPVQSTFSWTPTSGQTGSTVVTFTAVDTCAGLAQCSFTFRVTCPDNAPPSCAVTAIIAGPPKKVLVTVRDLQSGLASITVVTAINVTVSIPAFTVGTTNAVVVTATKINQSLSSTIVLRVTDLCGNPIVCDPVFTTISAEVPEQFSLGANYPNPFNPTTRINFNVAKAEGATSVNLKIYDLLGREVKTLISEPMQSGQYSVEWDGTNVQGNAVTSGVYIYRMVAGDFIATQRMTLMK